MTPSVPSQKWSDEVVIQPAGSECRGGHEIAEPPPIDLSEASLPSARSYLDATGEVPECGATHWQADWIEDA